MYRYVHLFQIQRYPKIYVCDQFHVQNRKLNTGTITSVGEENRKEYGIRRNILAFYPCKNNWNVIKSRIPYPHLYGYNYYGRW